MSINIGIGKLKILPEDPESCSYINFNVEEIFDKNAPIEGKNEINLSNRTMDEFIEITGLRKYFSKEQIRNEAGEYGIYEYSLFQEANIALLTKHHLTIFKQKKLESLTEAYPKFCIEIIDWFIYWMDFAIKNYQHPIFCFS
ncbi:hypothetical protein GCL60_16990 (plasmid) [Silvanigrella paludirubra]|uniref:Uncharacterized protein n=1 Tax=Silvanigrella paludirubra TaxID=2499159 RepID=A0A6N6VMJ3_9BACT|nr:hypothetical protein [Silvanigrella paludirubra]KAB8035644.1 hypothetical protein GCL60_16990 [Silvanigrella paludirubra]